MLVAKDSIVSKGVTWYCDDFKETRLAITYTSARQKHRAMSHQLTVFLPLLLNICT